ncbi:MAG: metal ABC transporter substrate-binding protein [Thermoanaerobaculia bacterium]
MKRILTLIAVLTIATNAFAADKLRVVTTIQDLASLTREVGGDKVDAVSIARGYQDPHFVEPKPSFLLLLRNADLLEVVGLELEIGWLPPLLDQSRNPNIRPGTKGYLDLSHGVEILDRPTGAVNRSMGDVHPMGNPHYWLDPANAVRMAIQIERKLEELRPQDASYFQQRLNAFKLRINDANKRWMTMMAPYRGAKIVTYHNSWPNFARHFGLDVVDYVEPKPGVPPSPSHTFQLINLMKAQKVRAIVMEPYFDVKTPQSIAERTGAQLVILYPSVGGGKSGTEDYFQLFETNIVNLIKALQQ